MAVNLNPMYLMFPAAVATSFAFMLPVATGANAIVFSYGFVKVVDMVRLSHAHPPSINISLIPCHMKKSTGPQIQCCLESCVLILV